MYMYKKEVICVHKYIHCLKIPGLKVGVDLINTSQNAFCSLAQAFHRVLTLSLTVDSPLTEE